MKIKSIVWILMLFLLVTFTSAIGVSPGSVYFYNTARGGYAEQEVLISELSIEDLLLNYEVTGVDWIEVEFENDYVSFNNPVKAIIKINVPEDAGNGNYSAKIRLAGTPKSVIQQGKTSSIVMGVSIDIFIQVIGDEIVSCIVGGVNVRTAEKNFPLEIATSIKNTGNVRIMPDVKITVFDQNQEETLLTKEYSANEVLPTTTIQSVKQLDNNLKVGQYWAEISVPVCGYEAIKTFDVVEKGEIVDSGELVRIETQQQINSDTITPIKALFKNTGQRTVTAKFKGEIIRNGKIVEIIESDSVDIIPGGVELFEIFYQPTLSGIYEVKGKVIYNNKLSYEKQTTMEVQEITGEIKAPLKTNLQKIIIFMIIIVIVLLLIIIRKKKKLRKSSRKTARSSSRKA
ncbi:hypothetical protein ACFLTH_09965 [Bacteroidota bacterium]